MECFFGWGLKFGTGASPSVAMNAETDIVMAHVASGHQLAYRWGKTKRATVEWSSNQNFAEGREPSIALSRTHVLAVHRGVDDDRTFYDLGRFANGQITWVDNGKYDEGLLPRIAINDSGTIVELHYAEAKNRIWYNIGRIENDKVVWKKKDDFADGSSPAVSINNFGQLIVAYVRDGDVYYRIGTSNGTDIEFQAEHVVAYAVSDPSVAVSDEGRYIVCYVHTGSGALRQQLGLKDGSTVSWDSALEYDHGIQATVATQTWLAIEVHSDSLSSDEYFSTSMMTDRSTWMADRPVQLGPVPLRELTIPGSHDAGMYKTMDGQSEGSVKTQDQHIDTQLMFGQRWFDLRVMHPPGVSELYIHHGGIQGPPLNDVLDQVKKFLSRGGRELVILKFSHFKSFDSGDYEDMVKAIENRLGTWLFRETLPPEIRLADVTLERFGAAVLVVVDGPWAVGHEHPGFWVYRNATDDLAAEGDLRVFDEYSDTNDYNVMKKEQIANFEYYDGYCTDEARSICDLFLLSWTLTPSGLENVKEVAEKPNETLANEVAMLPARNEFLKVMNIVYVDFAEYARPSDVAMRQNDEQGSAAG